MVIMDEVSSIKTFFQSYNVYLSTAWLEGCVSWCKEENLPANYTPKDLQQKVFEQWLLLDLRDVEVPCLPPDLSNKTKYILNGNYSLQMMKVIDISRPKHWQLQRIRNNVSKNAEPEVESSKRVLQLTLTDGVQEVEAMEYKTVSCLSLNLSPGIKVRLMGPITVRRGWLMLESKNVKVLGGEVDELIVPNAAENVLARILNLPLNPTPNVIEESFLTANKDMFDNTGETQASTQNQDNMRNGMLMSSNNRNVGNNTPVLRNQNSIINNTDRDIGNNNQTRTTNSAVERQILDANEEEELRIAEEIQMLMEAEADFEEPRSEKVKQKSRSPDMFDDDFNDSVFENIDIPPVVKKPEEPKPSTSHTEKQTSNNLDVNRSLDMESDFFENFDVDAHLDQAMKEESLKPSTPPKPLVLTIEKLLKNMPNIGNGKFKIKVKFNSVVEKLTFADEEYYLVIKVEDGTGDLNVRVRSDVVSDLAGSSPAELLSLRADLVGKDPDAQRKVLEVLRMLKERLLQLDHIVEVQVSTKEKFPVIINILD